MPELWWVAAVAGAVLVVLAGRWVWHLGRAVQVERARELFRLQHERFEELVLHAAAASPAAIVVAPVAGRFAAATRTRKTPIWTSAVRKWTKKTS